jgi:hypothetical protein
MLTRLAVRNFKLFDEVDIELGSRVVLVGPNNSGKTTVLQALALWSVGIRRWVEKRGMGNVPQERAGVTINRRDLIALPIPSANLLWRDLHVRLRGKEDGQSRTKNVLIDLEVDGIAAGQVWHTAREFVYANEESFYCRSKVGPGGTRLEVPKALKEIGFEHYLQAEQTGWVLYLEGSTDLSILKAFAEKLRHKAREVLDRAYVHYVGNQPQRARDHFYGLREAKPDLVGIALYDRRDRPLSSDERLTQLAWRRREIECYLCRRDVLLSYARRLGTDQSGPLFADTAEDAMARAIDEVEHALKTLGKPDPWSADCKVSDDFLDPVFCTFFQAMGLPEGTMRKTDFHTLAPLVEVRAIDPEVTEKLDAIVTVARRARPTGQGGST